MTEEEANTNLERAINDWHKTTYPDNHDLITGWVFITEVVPINDDRGTSGVTITTSDDMTLIRQLGILDHAQIISRTAVLSTE